MTDVVPSKPFKMSIDIGPQKTLSADYKIPKMAKKVEPAIRRVSSFGDFLVNLDASRRIKLDQVNFYLHLLWLPV